MTEKKSSFGAWAVALGLAAAFVMMILFVVFVFSTGSVDEPADESPAASAPVFSVPDESSEPEISEPVVIKTHMSEAEVGNLVYYGRYMQEAGYNANGTETPIAWIVLDKSEDSLLLLSYRCLMFWKYNDEREAEIGGFAESGLCKKLNDNFASSAFNETELGWILGEEGEKVFILSAEQANLYFEYNSHRAAKPTTTAAGEPTGENCMWWLADINDGLAAYVFTDGSIRLKGFAFDYDQVAVRPAIRVSIDAEVE